MTDRDSQSSQSSSPGDGDSRPSRFGPGGPRPRPDGDVGDRGRPRRFGGGGGRPGSRRKVCSFCMDNIGEVDYKDMQRLRRHLSERGKIEPRRKTGACAKHQRSLTVAIKRARHVALLPFVGGAGRP